MDLGSVPRAVMLLGVIAIVLGLVGTVLDAVQDTQTSGSYAYNATEYGLEGVDQFAEFQPTIAIVLVAGVILTVLGAFFALRG